MSWFKKFFSSQPSTSRTPTVKYIKVTDERDEDDNKKEEEQTTKTGQSTQEIDQTQESSCYSWSGASSLFSSQTKKRKWENNDKDEPWWESFKSEPSTQKTEEPWSQSFKSHSSQDSMQESTASSFEMTQQYQTQSNEEKDDNDDDEDKEKISFYLKLGKNKRFKYM